MLAIRAAPSTSRIKQSLNESYLPHKQNDTHKKRNLELQLILSLSISLSLSSSNCSPPSSRYAQALPRLPFLASLPILPWIGNGSVMHFYFIAWGPHFAMHVGNAFSLSNRSWQVNVSICAGACRNSEALWPQLRPETRGP